ncbi:MAG: hypothetical protein IK099_07560 [Clostridia bacterium]|nr:hypothetical protein [Clostridia bacterium]
MPKQSTYRFLTIAGFFLGVLWGALSYGPYNNMKAAIETGKTDEAWANAKKIRTYFTIGAAVNIGVMLLGTAAG